MEINDNEKLQYGKIYSCKFLTVIKKKLGLISVQHQKISKETKKLNRRRIGKYYKFPYFINLASFHRAPLGITNIISAKYGSGKLFR